MKVSWNKRSAHRHRQLERVGRIRARLSKQPVGDIRLGVPVVTDRQLAEIRTLAEKLGALRDEIDEKLSGIELALDCLRGENHPEGWATVEIVDRTADVLVATVKHHKPKTAVPDRTDRRKLRGYR